MSTKRLRYSITKQVIKLLTPKLWQKIRTLHTIGKLDFWNTIVSKVPRPSIEFCKEYFNGNKLYGVEIGVLRGKNSESILSLLNIDKLYLIDCWDNYLDIDKLWVQTNKNYYHVIKKFKGNEKVRIMKDYSEQAVNKFRNGLFDFVYIDGNHKYNSVFNDIKQWSKKVKYNGIVCGHDILNCPDVLRALLDYCIPRQIYPKIIPPDWYFIKI